METVTRKEKQLEDLYQVSEYQFQSFDSDKVSSNVKNYDFVDFTKERTKLVPEKIKVIHRENVQSVENAFSISPLVRQYRGHNQVDSLEREQKINEEINRRLLLLRDEQMKKGYNDGMERGKQEVYKQLMKETEEKLSHLSQMIETTLRTQSEVMRNQKDSMYKLIKNLTKWILLKEIPKESDYTKALLEKLLLEVEARSNILILVNPKDFNKMPEILEAVQKKLGALSNVRVETDPQIQSHGLIVETDNGILNASLEEQFKSLDKIFESVGAVDAT